MSEYRRDIAKRKPRYALFTADSGGYGENGF